MKVSKFDKPQFRFRSIQSLFLAAMVLLIVTLALPNLISGVRIIDTLIEEYGSEILRKELQSLIEPVNLRYKTLERIGLEDSDIHREEIKEHALKSFTSYHYKQSGTVFVINKDKTVLLSKNWANNNSKEFSEFFAKLQENTELFYVGAKENQQACIGRFYPQWQAYIGLTMSQEELFAPRYLFIQRHIIVLGFVLCIASLFAFALQQFIITPIIRLSRFADKVSSSGIQPELPGMFFFELGKMKDDIVNMVQTLTSREEKYRAVFNAPSEAIFLHSSLDGTILEVNQAFSAMFGYTSGEIIGKTVENLCSSIPPYTLEEAEKRVHLALTGNPQLFEWSSKKKDGTLFWTEVSLKSIRYGDENAVLAVARNIDEQKRAEVAIRESEDKFSKAFFSSPDSMSISELNTGKLLEVNQGFENVFGFTREETIGKTVMELGLYNDLSERTKMVEILKREGSIRNFDAVGIKKSGVTFRGSISSQIIEVKEEKCLLTITRDITERKKAEDELKQLRNYLANIIGSMPSILIGVDTKAQITLWNRAAEQTTGISADDAQGKNLSEMFPRMASEMKKISESIQNRETRQEQKRPIPMKNETRYEDLTIYPLITNGVDGAVIRIDDVTDKVRMEEMMIQSEKMLSVGGLAAGMAHEINNPLAGMMQTANVMANRLGKQIDIPANCKAAEEAGTSMEAIQDFMESRGIHRMISTINESGQRVAAIVDNMLSFARKSEVRSSPHNLAELLDKTLELAATDYDLKKHYDFKLINIKREYEPNLSPVLCEGAKIQQVLLNILRNAAQAMQRAETEKPKLIVRTYLAKNPEMAVMEIEDNGPGMDEETHKRIFEPFFTTKKVGEGTGLGLSVSYFIITENHGGKMTVKSRPGEGARFIIILPVKGETA